MKGYITAEEAAERLGYDYDYMLQLLREGKIEGAEYWHGYAVPENADIGTHVKTSREYKRRTRQLEKKKAKDKAEAGSNS